MSNYLYSWQEEFKNSTEKIETSEGIKQNMLRITEDDRVEGLKQNMLGITEDHDRAEGLKLPNREDIAKVQLDIWSGLSRFVRTLDFPETDIEEFLFEKKIDDSQRVILRVVNEISRNMINSGLIYRIVNTGEAQEVLEAITVQVKDLRSLLGLEGQDINLLQPEGQYPVSYLHTNLQIVSFYLEGLEEAINQQIFPAAIPDSSATVSSQQNPEYGERRNQLYNNLVLCIQRDEYCDRSDDYYPDEHCDGGDDNDPEAFRRDEDYEYDYYGDTSSNCQWID